ncbi:CBO0543 family protein [Paenibacillus soyae]|uniref:Uncharacterized protein n=1 Tax=Paenibacillus soyae TaxID=2969249 RepID=A0A9X2SAB9_9BACL|nr:CBO0543 family protein [Paenibacillus soyae]MCR2803647.1 hypothetical protein [Paenibacillus soyae]
MTLDRIVLLSAWLLTIILIVCFIPRSKIREAQIVFMFKQVLTWPLGVLIVQFGLIEYPVREFPQAFHSSFSFDYFIYPATCVLFVLRFPEGENLLKRVGWYLLFPSWMTVIEVLIEKYTKLILYVTWHWYWTWFGLMITFFLSRQYYLWFIKRSKVTIGSES